MNTKFKEVAHLHLGCDCLIDNNIRKLDTVAHAIGSYEVYCSFLGMGYECSDIKPILRPLSDITKDELSILWSIVFTREFNGVIHKHKANDTGRGTYAAERYVMSSGVERLGAEFDGNIWADSDLSVWRYNKHKTTAYLLSRSFDLFGLIESGEAIDKTKLQ